jgi:hypothetical protein
MVLVEGIEKKREVYNRCRREYFNNVCKIYRGAWRDKFGRVYTNDQVYIDSKGGVHRHNRYGYAYLLKDPIKVEIISAAENEAREAELDAAIKILQDAKEYHDAADTIEASRGDTRILYKAITEALAKLRARKDGA